MKRFLLILVISLMANQTTIAQEKEKEKKFSYGLLTGFDLHDFEDASSTVFSDVNISEFTSTYIGGFAEFKLSDKFQLRTELLYSMGANSDILEFPVLLKYKLCNKVFFYSGIQLNYLLEKKNDFYNNLGTGFNVGGQYYFSKKWFLDVRYVYKDSQRVKYTEDIEPQIQSIRLGVGFTF